MHYLKFWFATEEFTLGLKHKATFFGSVYIPLILNLKYVSDVLFIDL